MSTTSRSRANATCLFIAGTDGDRVCLQDGRVGMLGNNDLYQLLGDPSLPLVQLTGDFLDHSVLPDVSSYRCLVNVISDADRNPRMLESLDWALRDFDGRIVNPPSEVLKSTRDQVARQLAGTPGLRVPKVVRLRRSGDAQAIIERENLSLPIILRRAATHGGKVLGLFDNMTDLRRAVPGDADLYATEFADFRSADGLYRKFRIFVYGGSIVLRHMIVSDRWNIHGRDRKRLMLGRADLREQERRLLEQPRIAFNPSVLDTLKAVRKRTSLDYFGMDFGIDRDGAVVLFEANATMDFISSITDPEFAYANQTLPTGRSAIRAMIPELPSAQRTMAHVGSPH